jgi:hypothetical protein
VSAGHEESGDNDADSTTGVSCTKGRIPSTTVVRSATDTTRT